MPLCGTDDFTSGSYSFRQRSHLQKLAKSIGSRFSVSLQSGLVTEIALSMMNWIRPGLVMHTVGPPWEGATRWRFTIPHQSGCLSRIRLGTTLAKLCG